MAHALSLAAQVQTVILAGGLGSRLQPVLGAFPKVVAPVHERPFIRYLLDELAEAGVVEVTLATGFRADEVRSALGSEYSGIRLTYSTEQEPLGTGGALRYAIRQSSQSSIMVLNGDSYIDVDLCAFLGWRDRQSWDASLVLTHVPDTSRFGAVSFDDSGRVTGLTEKEAMGRPGWINAGIYLLPRKWILELAEDRQVSLEREALPGWLVRGLGAFLVREPFIDIGTPDAFRQAEGFFERLRRRKHREEFQLPSRG